MTGWSDNRVALVRRAGAAVGRLARRICPPARHPVTGWQVLPPVLFLALFGGACVALSVAGRVVFSSLWPFALLAFVPWIWWMQLAGMAGGLTPGRAFAALVTRLGVLGVMTLALADPRWVRESKGLSLMYALDLSDSMGEKVSDKSLAYILKTASEKPEQDEAGLLVFGRDAAVELPPRVSFPFEVINSRVAQDGTDLAKALSLASAMVPDSRQGRVVLVSDGVETEGRVARLMDELQARKIPVDVLPVQYAFTHEVWLERLEVPRAVKVGETYEASVLLSSLQPGRGRLVLTENGKKVAEQAVEYVEGKNRFSLPLYFREPGYYEYLATIEPEPGRDGWAENNVAMNHLYLKGEGRVLVLVDPLGGARDSAEFVAALKEARRTVDVRTAYECPRDSMSLLPYDAIVLANVPADAFDAAQLQALRDAAFNQGLGLLMVGGKNSFGAGGYHLTPVEEALPVTMDVTQKKVLPKGALVIVLHTCEFAAGNVWAKRVAKEAIRVLSAKDEAGLLIYGAQGDRWVFPLTPAGEYERLVALINQCDPSDMPSFASIMTMGIMGLEASDAAMKHMIIISDGDPSPPPPELVKRFVAGKVSVTSVIINPHGGQDVSMMQALASETGGRYYRVDDPQQLPSIFIKEAKTLTRTLIQNKTVTPEIGFPSPVLKGIEGFPPLHGYVLTSAKPRSSVILRTPETEEVEPLLATWRFGLGKTAAFTSDLSANWARDWVAWARYKAFVQQLMVDISRVEQQQYLQMRTFAAGDEGVVSLEDTHADEVMLDIQAQVHGPRQQAVTLKLRQTGPRRYEARFPLWGKGRYQVVAMAAAAGRSDTAMGGFALAYSPEYLRFRSDPLLLRQIADRTGGRLLSGRETGKELFAVPRVVKTSSQPLVAGLLVLLACLIPLDVAMRRVQIDWAVVRGWFGRRHGRVESTETMGALLKRKEQIAEARAGEGAGAVARPSVPRAPAVVTVRKPDAPASEPARAEVGPAPEPEEARSTTERLLALKRKRQKTDGEQRG